MGQHTSDHDPAGPDLDLAASAPEGQSVEVRLDESDSPAGLLLLAATPIGNLADASPRLATELARADLVAAEDTRRLPRLFAALGVIPTARTMSVHDHNEAARIGDLVEALVKGARIVLVSDAGMPTVSDPGYRLVTAAIAAGVRVSALPGPSAVLTALAVSGLPVDRFCFEGFLPRRGGERARRLRALASEPRTMVFFEAPHRLGEALAAMVEVFGADRSAAVCRELSKTYEEIRRGSLTELAAWAQQPPRGEITLVVAGAPEQVDVDAAMVAVRARISAGERMKEACRQVAALTGVSSRQLYERALAERTGDVDG